MPLSIRPWTAIRESLTPRSLPTRPKPRRSPFGIEPPDACGCYRSKRFNAALGPVVHTFTRPCRPQTNGKVERFNRTLLAEWAYVRTWTSEGQRARWLHVYNHHRHRTAIGGPPVSRAGNVSGHYS
jgi:transposase InsO family protein